MIRRNRSLQSFLPLLVMGGLVAAAPAPGYASVAPGCPELKPDSVIRVRTLEDIDSTASKVGDTFNAELEGFTWAKAGVVITEGTPAKLRLVRLLQPKGSAEPPLLALKLVEIRPNNAVCEIATGFGEISSSPLDERAGKLPEGTTSENAVTDALSENDHLGNSVAAVVNGAGESFDIASGHEIRVAKGITLRFEVPDLMSVE